MRAFLKKLEAKSLEPLVLRLLAAWCLSSSMFVLWMGGNFTSLEAAGGISAVALAVLYLLSLLLIFLCGLIGNRRRKKQMQLAAALSAAGLQPGTEGGPAPSVAGARQKAGGRIALPVCFAIYSCLTLKLYCDFYFAFILTVFWAILIFYYHKRGYLTRRRGPFTKKHKRIVLWIAAAVFVLVVGGTGVFRYIAYRTPNYDFGIFAQMFHNMKTQFLPLTTCERDRLLSHFAVHFSPICYVLLPVYFIFPSPVTLQLAQAILLASAVIPLTRLCRRYALSQFATAAMGCLLLLYPATAGGTNYDFHENCFLLPLLLWVFCLFEEERWLPMSVCAVLTLLVKEDAAVYLLFFALFVFLDRRKFGVAALLAAGAAVYFVGALYLLRTYGDGVMEGRYGNFIAGDGGLLEAVKNVLADPGYAFTQIFVNKEGDVSEKVLFLLQMLAPVAFLPFCVKRVSRLLLLLPMLLLNLLTVYAYQFDINYQYSFGVTAFVFYLCVLNLSDLPKGTAKRALLISLACGAMCFIVNPIDRVSTYGAVYFGSTEEVRLLNEAFSEIPADATVAASTYFVPHFSDHETVYEIDYHKPAADERLDYVLVDMRFNHKKDIPKYNRLGYEVTKTVSTGKRDILVVMQPVEKGE